MDIASINFRNKLYNLGYIAHLFLTVLKLSIATYVKVILKVPYQNKIKPLSPPGIPVLQPKFDAQAVKQGAKST